MAVKTKSESMAGSLGMAKQTSSDGMAGMSMAAVAGLESLELDATTADEIINNVEKMISAEKSKDKMAKKDKRADQKTLDLTSVPGATKSAAANPGSDPAGRRGTVSAKSSTAAESMDAGEEEQHDKVEGTLDNNLSLIRRKTIAIKSDNLSNMMMGNINSISESVATFQKMEEESGENDIALQY